MRAGVLAGRLGEEREETVLYTSAGDTRTTDMYCIPRRPAIGGAARNAVLLLFRKLQEIEEELLSGSSLGKG